MELATRANQCLWKYAAGTSCGEFRGEWVHPSVSRSDSSLLWAKACNVLSRSLRIMCAASMRRVSRMSRTEDRPDPMPRVCMNNNGEEEERARRIRFLNTAAIWLSMASSSASVIGTMRRTYRSLAMRTELIVYWNCLMDSCLCCSTVSILCTSALSLLLAGSQLPVGDNQPPRYRRGSCGGVTADGVMCIVPSGALTGILADV